MCWSVRGGALYRAKLSHSSREAAVRLFQIASLTPSRLQAGYPAALGRMLGDDVFRGTSLMLRKGLRTDLLFTYKRASMDSGGKDLREENAAVADAVRMQMENLRNLKITELRTRYRDLFGEASPASNRTHLFRRIAWRLQAQAEGD